jgi:integrase
MAVRKRAWTTRKGEQKTAWVVDYRDQSGKRHIETFDRKKRAVTRAAEVSVNIKRGTHVAPSESITVAEAAQGWLKDVVARGREEGTLHQYRQHVRTHIVPRIGRIKLAKLTDATLLPRRVAESTVAGDGAQGAHLDQDDLEAGEVRAHRRQCLD